MFLIANLLWSFQFGPPNPGLKSLYLYAPRHMFYRVKAMGYLQKSIISPARLMQSISIGNLALVSKIWTPQMYLILKFSRCARRQLPLNELEERLLTLLIAHRASAGTAAGSVAT